MKLSEAELEQQVAAELPPAAAQPEPARAIDYANFNGERVLVLHFQGTSKTMGMAAIGQMRSKAVVVPGNIGIVTFASARARGTAMLLDQLERDGVSYINAAEGIAEWRNTLKPALCVQALDRLPAEAEYALVLDGGDVLLNGDISEITARFAEYETDVLFGASKNNYPDRLIDKVEGRDWRGNFKYLNAGTCFGKTDRVRAFYEKVVGLGLEDNDAGSEQLMVRAAFDTSQDWVDFDSRCRIFQTFSKTRLTAKDLYTWKVV